MMNKIQLRKKYRGIRLQIPAEYKQNAAGAAAHILASQPLFKQSEHIACYMAFRDEFDLNPVIQSVWETGKHCYLPVLIQQNEHAALSFVVYNKGDPLRPNRFGILEPEHGAKHIETGQLDLVLAPLIAFDRRGHRLGTGGGYYDRTLKDFVGTKPVVIGIGYAAQEANALPDDPWDIRVNGIVTEKEFISFF